MRSAKTTSRAGSSAIPSELPPHVAVCGAGGLEPDSARLAEQIGAEIALQGAVVVCGGLGGVMEAACRGARSNGGLTIGILPGSDRREANEFVDVAIPTGMGEMRNALVVRAADAIIAVSGEFGTLSEIAFALKLGKRVVGLSTWSLSRDGRLSDAILTADSAPEAVRLALA